jgi:hypothetical protein
VVAKPAAIPKPADAPRATASSNRTPPRSDALGQSRGDAIEEPPRSLAWGAGAAFVVLLAIVAIGLWYRSRGVEPPAATSQSSQPGPETTAAPATPPATPAKPAPKPAEQPATKAVTPPKPPPAKPETRTAAAAPAKGAPTVVEASVCRNLVTSGNWRCQAPPSPIAAGPLVFYTRVKSERNTKVQHRWYRGNQLVKSSDLMITANPGTGYRTYSRLTVSGSGDWRVELRSADGALLREERFTVR